MTREGTPRRVLVTGGEGLVGSVLVRLLRACGHEVTTLTLPDAAPHEDVRVVRGDARDPAAVARALDGAGAVAHLAAIADPWHEPATEVFATNTSATFTVLWTAAQHGVRRLAVASSVNAAGRLLNPHRPAPPAYPIDESVPADVADPYSLSKHVDELTLRAVCRRFGAAGVALRLPLVVAPESAAGLRAWSATRLAESSADGWGWIDVRDAAEAFRLALTGDYDGPHVVQVAADETFADIETEELIERYAPHAARTARYPGHAAPIDTSRARDLLGFVARHGYAPDDEKGLT
jgi:nucleoside-diphosphate-sugar epimerase